MRIVLVANNRSGTGTHAKELTERLERHGAQVVAVVPVQALGDPKGAAVEELPDALARASFDRLVVAGGDGSIGLAARAAARLGVPLAVIPTGTANDFARSLDLPLDLEAATAFAAGAAPARMRAVDLARVGDRPWVNAASAGLSVLAAREAHSLKPRLGAVAYLVGALRAGLTGRPLHVVVPADGQRAWEGAAWQVIIGATGAFGGGAEIGGVTHGDGELDTAIVPAGSRLGLARTAVGMRLGRLTAQRAVAHVRAQRIDIEAPAGTRFNVDGEVCTCAPAHFEVESGALEVLVPA
ncbi:MAG TPA: diacylglycerol kinase family protein [Solirubrobacteraceae bacterium]|nr:diacylglycerol kinase family protein [Solirubrobacteraceae bacterium]